MEPAGAPKLEEGWRIFATAYLFIQSSGALAWWAVMFGMPELRSLFVPGQPEVLWALLVPDLVLFVGAGLLSAVLLLKHAPRAKAVLLIHVGGALYSSLFTWSFCLMHREAWLGAALMTPPMIVTPLLAWRVAR